MLLVNDLINIDYIPKENDISLQLLVDFYEKYLCQRIFIFTLKNGTEIKLFFRDATEIFHISGIDHIYEGIPMDGTRFVKEVKEGKIDIDTIKTINASAYKDYELRICSMACLDSIIKKCEYLWYSKGKIPDSTIEVKYLLLKGMDGKNLHLGIDTYNVKRPYYSKTLLVTEGNSLNKFIGKADERLRVSKLEIRDKNTDCILECIERELAEYTALQEVRMCMQKWLDTEFSVLLMDYFLENASESLLEVWLKHISVQELDSMFADIKAILEMKSDICDMQEWRKLYEEVMKAILDSQQNVNNMVLLGLEDLKEYQSILKQSINRTTKKAWRLDARNYIEEHKPIIKKQIDVLDAYWSGKIVAEAIREFDKEEAYELIEDYVEHYIALEGKNVIVTILVEIISKRKESVISNINIC